MAAIGRSGCDANDPHRIAQFWAKALGYIVDQGYDNPDGASIVDPAGKGPAIRFLKVPERKTAEHIDIRVVAEPSWDVAGRERQICVRVQELMAPGATEVREEHYGEHWAMS
jgi:hypothetical protein